MASILTKMTLRTWSRGTRSDISSCSLTHTYSYEFNFSYPSKDSYAFELFSTGSRASEEPSRSEVAKTTHQLVRRLLVLTQSLEPLPEHAFITMRLYYTDDTPIEYEPPQFMPCTSDNVQPVGQDVKIGKVQTKHHEMTCKVTTRASEIPRPNVEESTQDLIKGLNLRPCSLEPTQTKDEEEEEEGLSINVIGQDRLPLIEEHELLNQLFGGESGDSELDRLPLPLDMDLDLDLDQVLYKYQSLLSISIGFAHYFHCSCKVYYYFQCRCKVHKVHCHFKIQCC